MLRILPHLSLCLLLPTIATANESIAVPFLKQIEQPEQVTIHTTDGNAEALEIRGTDKPSTICIAELDRPTVKSSAYVLRGEVKYEGVIGPAYLEMCNQFGENKYFSRTLGTSGVMGRISDTSDWRKFELPFQAESGMRPDKLTVNVVLPGEGKIAVRNLTLESLAANWWSPQHAGLYGGIGGALCGTFGAVIGIFAARRKSRSMVIALMRLGVGLGAVSLIAGIVAVILQQPYHVYYPLLLLGGISVFVLGGNSLAMARRFREEELRHMSALDA